MVSLLLSLTRLNGSRNGFWRVTDESISPKEQAMDATQTAHQALLAAIRPLLFSIVMSAIIMHIGIGESRAQSTVVSPAGQSPHWSHINISDFGRALPYQGDASVRSAAYNWFNQHVDLAEVNGNATDLRASNPSMLVQIYHLDLSTFANADSANLPEEYFLHFAEDTQMQYRGLDGSTVSTVTVTGCPSPQTVNRNCRVQTYLWSDRRYVFNLKSSTFQDWKATQLVNSAGRSINGVFLDEHGPGFVAPFSWGNQSIVQSGGAIRELNGLRPGSTGDALDQDYNTAVVAWLTYLRTRFQQAGKYIILNPATYLLDPMVVEQVKALQGVSTEFMHRPDVWAGAYQYQQFIDAVKDVSSNGGVVQLDGTWCYTGPSGYTNGNYGSSAARYRMWRLASYYVLKESVGSPGMVYFDLALCSNISLLPLADANEWLSAYQVNVGQPVGDSYVYQQGMAGIASSDGRRCTYTIFGRTYTNALMLVRPKDFWDCTDYGEGGAAVVTLSHPGYLLKEDGTLSAQTTTVTLRNAEAVIVYGISTPPSNTPSTPPSVAAVPAMQSLISTAPSTPATPVIPPTPSTTPSSTSNRQTTERSSESVVSGFFNKLKNLMQRVK
jgi:hypothetical protein